MTAVQPQTDAAKAEVAANAPGAPTPASTGKTAQDAKGGDPKAEAAKAQSGEAKAADDKAKADQSGGGSSAPRWNRQIPQRAFGLSPLRRQEKEPTNRPDYTPVAIVFLDGPHANRQIDLGLWTEEFSSSQPIDWGVEEGGTIRAGGKFNRVSPRTSRLELEFFALEQDVAHLSENLMHMGEIVPDLGRPPLLHLQAGVEEHSPCVCTEISPTRSVPHPGAKGYRRAKVSLQFTLFGGPQSEHQLGKPLAATPLNNLRLLETPQEAAARQRGAIAAQLAECLGAEGSQKVSEAIAAGKLSDPATLLGLPAGSLTQLAIAGQIPPEALKDERVAGQLRGDLAGTIAATEPGIAGNPNVMRRFADAIATGNGAGLPAELAERATQAQGDFEKLSTAIAQPMGAGITGLSADTDGTALERLTRFGSCGLKLRNTSGTANVKPENAATAKKIDEVNAFFDGKPDAATVAQRFGIDEKAAQRLIDQFNEKPFSDRADFARRLAIPGGGLEGVKVFDRFGETSPPEGAN